MAAAGVLSKADVAQAADVLRALLDRVQSGALEAPGVRGAAVRRRLEGALLGLDAASGGRAGDR